MGSAVSSQRQAFAVGGLVGGVTAALVLSQCQRALSTAIMEDASASPDSTRSTRKRAQPALHQLLPIVAAGEDEKVYQVGVCDGVAMLDLPPETVVDEKLLDSTPWAKWNDPWCGNQERGGAKVFVPSSLTHGDVCIIYIHGGSFMYGSPTEMGYDSICSRIAAGTGLVTVCPDHLLCGEGRPFKAAQIMKQLLQDVLWLRNFDPVTRGARSSPVNFIFAGDSSGATQAISLLYLVAQEQPELLSAVKGVVMLSPWLDLQCGAHSYISNAFNAEALTGDVAFRAPAGQNQADFRQNGLDYVGSEDLLMQGIYSPYWLCRLVGDGAAAGSATDRQLLECLMKAQVPVWACIGASEALVGEVLDFAQRFRGHWDMEVWVHEGMFHVWPTYESEHPFPSKAAAMGNMFNFVSRILKQPPILETGIQYFIDTW